MEFAVFVTPASGFGVQVLGFRVQGLGFRDFTSLIRKRPPPRTRSTGYGRVLGHCVFLRARQPGTELPRRTSGLSNPVVPRCAV